jgi:hypothetical protein
LHGEGEARDHASFHLLGAAGNIRSEPLVRIAHFQKDIAQGGAITFFKPGHHLVRVNGIGIGEFALLDDFFLTVHESLLF